MCHRSFFFLNKTGRYKFDTEKTNLQFGIKCFIVIYVQKHKKFKINSVRII